MEKNTSKCKICLFWYFQHGEKREKGVAGHESDKLIEQYSAQPTIKKKCSGVPYHRATVRVIFDYQAIYNLSKFRSDQPVLTDGPHYFFYLFFLRLPQLSSSTATNSGFANSPLR